MPELPEVETIAQDLHALIVDKEIASVSVKWERIIYCPTPDEFRRNLVGRRIISISRRGKYLVAQLSDGNYLLVHLRMTGQLLTSPPAEKDRKHVHVVFEFADGTSLYYADLRKFGRFYLVSDTESLLGDLGPEPLSPSFSASELHERLSKRKRRIKPLLLDQHFIAGLGNIYVDESLHRAKIHPSRRASELSREETVCLYDSIVAILSAAIASRGTTLSDYRDAKGNLGSHQNDLQVFRKAGQPCPRCGHPIERLVVAQRGTYICPACQPLQAQDTANCDSHSLPVST